MGELPTRVVLVNNVTFKVDMDFRRASGVEPRGIILPCVLEQLHLLSFNQGRARGACKGLVRKPARRLDVFQLGHDWR